MTLAERDKNLISIKIDKDHDYIKIFNDKTQISGDITGFEWKGYE